ncbi:hypothetical protein KFE25_003376 [Diacronema lutheri]|uniref:Procollagen-proline 4-dioxygenase n=2 Tax=Diacronema lutheri TaxID=2081491 RepID=A0A8J5XCU8_DIALT|nr:hypothetical protein KFE25_003376 [Diacronema lutheri]
MAVKKPAKGGAPKDKSGNVRLSHLAKPLSLAVALAAVGYAAYASSRTPAREREPARPASRARGAAEPEASAHVVHPWRRRMADVRMTMPECLAKQRKLTHIPAIWPGFHALCVESVSPSELVVLALVRGDDSVRTVRGRSVLDVLDALKPLLESDYGQDDPTIVDSVYAYPPHAWELFSPVGEHITHAQVQLSAGDLACVYEGGQFIWPGWEIGHVTNIEVPVVDASTREEGWRVVPITTVSLRPLAFELSGFLTDEECAFIIEYASKRLFPSPLAHMDSSNRKEEDVRTSTQTFMTRGGSRVILNLEHRAHNLTRLPYELGESIQVVKYQKGQKYGAHRDFFSANDYHQQPAMLASVEYGARNRLATLFWYVSSVHDGGETFFPRALNASGVEYNPWNGDHEDCYRGLAVKPIKGNAVLFYSLLPNGHLDERSLHGGCKPRGADDVVKWGANQWIWNQPQRHHGKTFPRKDRPARPASSSRPGCEDASPDCAAWAATGECSRNPSYMLASCRASCGHC